MVSDTYAMTSAADEATWHDRQLPLAVVPSISHAKGLPV